MNPSRREFLQKTALTAAGIWVAPLAVDAPLFAGAAKSTETKGLLFDAHDIPRMRETVKHPRFAEYWKSLTDADLQADRKFLKDELRLNNHVKDMLQARQILERTAFVYALTGSAEQAEIAKLAISRLLQYKRWDYFLEGGEHTIGLQRAPEATIAMSCAREWLDPVLSDETKTEMEKQIAEKGAPACFRTLYGMKYPDRVRGWGFDPESDYAYRFDLRRWPFILNATNLKAIPIAGLGIAGCLLYGRHPEAEHWIDLALQSAKAFAVMFGPDGSYDEGVGYWGYTAQHLSLFIEVLRRKLGIDERSLINFPGTVRYGLRMSMPSAGRPDDCVNFSDAWAMGDVSVAAWTARIFKDQVAQYVATSVGIVRSNLGVIWFDPDVPSQVPGPDLFDVRFSNDWVVARTGWDEKSSVVALRSGGPSNHEHADRNSVIFKAYGERLFHDPFKAAYSHTDAHWNLRLTQSHTAILIDGKGHQYHDGHEGTNASWAEAKVVDYRPSKQSMIVTSDATEAYRLVDKDVNIVRRTLVFLKPDVLLLLDRVRFAGTAKPVQMRYQVYNADGKGTSGIVKNAFEISRPAASLHAMVDGGVKTTVHSGTLPVPEANGIHPYVEVNSEAAIEHLVLTVCTAQETGKNHGQLTVTRKGNVWTIAGKHNALALNVRIDVSNDLPDVVL